LDPANLLSKLQQAQSLLQSGRHAEAWEVMAPLRQAIALHGQALRLYALSAQACGRIDEAAEALAQVASQENHPPDIVGAMADMLGKAGRFDEALEHWSALVQRHPGLADGHLNRAVTAANAGQHQLSLEAAEEGLLRFPGHARLLAVKAMALKNLGRIEESVRQFEHAVAADPGRALTRHNQAVALRAACRYGEACEAFAAAEKLGMDNAGLHANWAAAALEAGDVAAAGDLYRRALKKDPTNKEALRGLTRLEIEYCGGTRAFDHYEQALKDRKYELPAWFEWINAMLGHNRFSEAQEAAEKALREYPEEPALLAMAAFGAGMTGKAGPQLERLEEAYRKGGDPPLAWMALLALRSGMPDRAAVYAERITKAEPTNQGAWSTLSIAWRLLDDPREHWLCNYDCLVMETQVPSIDGSQAPATYAAAVAAALDPLHQSLAAPGDQSLREGTQTSGELFQRMDPAILAFRDAVLCAAQARIADLPDDPGHPFLSRKSNRLGFAGSWSVRLKAEGGHHVPHYHDQGWMSSAYYARLPRATEAEAAGNEGWIQFGQPPATFGLDLPPRRILQPRVGKLVLFPSYMWHGTIPFSRGDRLTAAFDYLPL
jgi:tetratricopeptide (TPR) repeat protein